MLRQSNSPVRFSSRFVRGVTFALVAGAAIGVAGLRAQSAAIADEPAAAAPAEVPTAANVEPAESIAAPTLYRYPPKPEISTAVTALLRLSRPPGGIAGTGNDTMSDNAWKVNFATQRVLLKSYYVLNAALQRPGIAELPIVKSQQSPVDWLARSLEVGIYPNTEILYLRLPTSIADADQSRHVLNAVVQAYLSEVVNAVRQRRLASRDSLARSLAKLEEELKQKMSSYFEIAKDLESAEESGSGKLLQELDIRRLDRVETELMRLEDELLKSEVNGDSGENQITYLKRRIDALRDRQSELEKVLRVRSEKSIDLAVRKSELDQLKKLAADLSLKLEMTDVDLSDSNQVSVQIVQPATLEGGDSRPADQPSPR